MAKTNYLVDAAKQIRLALDCEVGEDYQAAFNHYKNGVDLLLRGVQVDPNKEQREAVKRKTTQYLKRAEEIFNSHLQGSSGPGKATSLCGGYSSLRFRPIRNLSTPVEDLKMCKVIEVIDKVLTVQSLVTKETFVVKSLQKSSGQSHEQPTIIPEGVPFMVKLLRYYVGEDAVYLHLGRVLGGRLFSKLHRSRKGKMMEHPECCDSTQRKIRLKTSYTAPIISVGCQQGSESSESLVTMSGGQRDPGDSPDADPPSSWEEAERQLEDGRTHPYCEETGCLHSARARLLEKSWSSEPAGQDAPVRADAAHGTTFTNTQEDTTQTSSTTSDPSEETVQSMGSSLHASAAWKATKNTQNSNPDKMFPANNKGLELQEGNKVPQIDQFSRQSPASQSDEDNQHISINPQSKYAAQIVQLPFRKRDQAAEAGEETFSTEAASFDCDANKYCGYATGLVPALRLKAGRGRERIAEAIGLRAAPKEQKEEACSGNSQSSSILPLSKFKTQNRTMTGISTDTPSPMDPKVSADRDQEKVADEEWEMLSPVSKTVSQRKPVMGEQRDEGPDAQQCSMYVRSRRAVPDELVEDQPIEVNGWFLIPRTSAERPREKIMKGSWGLPEEQVCVWGAQILLALESLHQQGILCRDLNPKNILLDSSGNVCLTYFGQWSDVQQKVNTKAMERMYCAPEIGGVSEIREACDWWSLGALLYELLTGMPLCQSHPAGVLPHTQLLIPDHLSTAAASLLTELLQFDAGYRLGSGGGGVADIKCHPFFSAVPWHALGS